jgi:hypothetical protein
MMIRNLKTHTSNFKWYRYVGLISVFVLCVFIAYKIVVPPNPKGMSPKEIVELYHKARNSGDTKLLKQIIYFEPGTIEEQKQTKVKSVLACLDEKLMVRSVGLRRKVKYQKYIDDNTAEVGTVGSSIFLPWKQYPGNQIILKKQDGIWKYSHIMAELPKDVLIENLKKHPLDFDLYFHLGRVYLDENPAKAHRYFIKYYELAPKGFWVDEDFLAQLKEYKKEFNDPETYEKQMLNKINSLTGSNTVSKAVYYRKLGQLFMELHEYQKAESYFRVSDALFKIVPSPACMRDLQKSKEELQLRLEGQYHDILDEIEAKQKK